MTPDLAVRPVPDWTRGAHQIVIFTETEPVLNLQTGKALFDDIAC
jgi:hypothetical protein